MTERILLNIHDQSVFTDILDIVGEAIISVDANYRILLFNKKAEQIFGYAADEILGQSLNLLLPQKIRVIHQDHMDGFSKFDTSSRLMADRQEVFGLRRNGEEFPAEASISKLEIDSHQIFTVIVRDITEHKQAEEALRESRERLIKAGQVARMGFLDWDIKTNEIVWSNEIYNLYGIDPELPVTIEQTVGLVHPADREYVDENLNLAIQGAREYKIDHRVVRPDGRVIWVHARADLEQDEEGRPVALLGTVVDITERKLAEEALRKREATLTALLNAPLDTVALLDPDGNVFSINESGARRLGFTPEEMIGRSIYNGMPPEVVQSRKNFGAQVLQTGEAVSFEDYRSGVHFANNLYPVFDQGGEQVESIAVFANDITERVQAEQQIQEYQQRLIALATQLTLAEEQERRRIAGELHDQISQTLALARLRLGSAQKVATDSAQMAILDQVSKTLLNVIQDTVNLIFDLSPPLLTEIGLEAAISEWLVNHVENIHGLSTEFIEDGQPLSLDDDLTVMLFRCVRELLTNVIRHAEATQVTVQVKRSAASATIIVEDNGVGFEGKTTDGSVKRGSGFGLFSIHERMNDLGGSFEIDSEPGLGCRAILITPIS